MTLKMDSNAVVPQAMRDCIVNSNLVVASVPSIRTASLDDVFVNQVLRVPVANLRSRCPTRMSAIASMEEAALLIAPHASVLKVSMGPVVKWRQSAHHPTARNLSGVSLESASVPITSTVITCVLRIRVYTTDRVTPKARTTCANVLPASKASDVKTISMSARPRIRSVSTVSARIRLVRSGASAPRAIPV